MGSNTYDFENHLVAAGGVSLVYDGDGNRVKETIAGVATSYLVADQNLTGYAQVMDELQNGSVSRTYTYGLSLISQRQTANGQGLSFYGFDGHGSVRFLTSPTGAVTDTYDYDAFGNVISHTGSTSNNYLFAGEQFDPALGIYYNRARYYDQRQGRFWTMDSAFPRVREPLSLHRYVAFSQNPLNRSGHLGLEDADLGDIGVALAEDEVVNTVPVALEAPVIEATVAPQIVAEAPHAFGFLAKAIASLSIGTIAFGSYYATTGSSGQVPTDQALAEANSNNYDIDRFGNATGGIYSPRINNDYVLNNRGLIDPQSFNLEFTYKGASAFRDPNKSGLTGVVYRVGVQQVIIADGLAVVPDGQDVIPNSPHPIGHHTILPTVEISPVDFDQRLRSLPWVRMPERIK